MIFFLKYHYLFWFQYLIKAVFKIIIEKYRLKNKRSQCNINCLTIRNPCSVRAVDAYFIFRSLYFLSQSQSLTGNPQDLAIRIVFFSAIFILLFRVVILAQEKLVSVTSLCVILSFLIYTLQHCSVSVVSCPTNKEVLIVGRWTFSRVAEMS